MDSKVYNIIVKKAEGTTLSPDEDKVLVNFLDKKENSLLYNDIIEIWNNTKNQLPQLVFDTEIEWVKFKQTINKQKKTKIRKLISFSSAVAASVIILISLFVNFNNDKEDSLYSTGNEIAKIILDDNSIITLNKNSSLSICKDFNNGNRNVTLHGEAFFNVAKNKKLPFKIALENNLVVEVVGTSFNIRSYSNELNSDISVISGIVNVEKRFQNSIRLERGNQAIYNRETNKLSKRENSNEYITAWKTGEFNFDNTSLYKLKEPFERYFNIEIEFPKNYSSLNYSGQFINPSTDEFAQTIAVSFGWKYSISKKKITFSKE